VIIVRRNQRSIVRQAYQGTCCRGGSGSPSTAVGSCFPSERVEGHARRSLSLSSSVMMEDAIADVAGNFKVFFRAAARDRSK
jgi:hypothetical protein